MSGALWVRTAHPRRASEARLPGRSIHCGEVYVGRYDRPPGQSWWTFLRNHMPEMAAMDLFVVPTLAFNLLYGFVVVRFDRRDSSGSL